MTKVETVTTITITADNNVEDLATTAIMVNWLTDWVSECLKGSGMDSGWLGTQESITRKVTKMGHAHSCGVKPMLHGTLSVFYIFSNWQLLVCEENFQEKVVGWTRTGMQSDCWATSHHSNLEYSKASRVKRRWIWAAALLHACTTTTYLPTYIIVHYKVGGSRETTCEDVVVVVVQGEQRISTWLLSIWMAWSSSWRWASMLIWR